MERLIKSVKYWGQLLLLPIYWLSFWIPRDKHIWLFGSTFGRRFADNPKYMYLFLNQFKADKIKAVWISKNIKIVKQLNQKGYPAFYLKSWKGFYYCIRAKVYIFDNYSKDICFWLSGGAIKVNLWHGTATKKINQDNKFDFNRHPRTKKEWLQTFPIRITNEKPSHYVLATSENMADIMQSAFGILKSHVLVAGHPRNDILFHDGLKDVLLEEEEDACSHLKFWKKQYKTCIFYAPTFRDSEKEIFNYINFASFNEFLKENHYFLILKLHMKSKMKEPLKQINYSNIGYVSPDVDTSAILEYADLLIVDYSSIYLDYMMLERPVVAFPFDYEEYVSCSRECYFEYSKFMPEIKAHTQKELEKAILQVLEKDIYFEKRMERRKFHFIGKDSKSSERLYVSILNLCNFNTRRQRGGKSEPIR